MGSIDDIRDILRGALASLGGFGGRMFARLVLMLVAGQLYGASPVGVLGQVAAITEILAAVAVIGLKRSLLDLLSDKAKKGQATEPVIKEALLSSLLLAVLMAIVLGLSWPLLFPKIEMPLFLYGAVPAIVFAEVAGTAIRYKRIIRWEVIARCIMEPWAFLGFAVALYSLGQNETGLIASYAISAIAAATGIYIGLTRAFDIKAIAKAPINWRTLHRILLKSLPVGITDIGVMMFRRLDILVLSLVAGHQATGIYYMAQQIVSVPHKIHQLFQPMMAPVMAKLHHENKKNIISEKLANLCRWVFTLQLAVTVPFGIFAAQLLGLFGDQFALGAMVLTVLLFAELIDGSFELIETPLIFAKPDIPPKLVMITLCIELAAIAVFGYYWGATGAAFGFFTAMTCLTAARLIALKKHLKINVINRSYMRPISFAVVISALLVSLEQFMPVSQTYVFGPAIIMAISLFLWMVKLLALTPADKEMFAQLRSR